MASTLYGRLIAQLDGLVVFMGLRDPEFFKSLQRWWRSSGETTGDAQPPQSAEEYEQTIFRSALVLGVAYAEAYLADALRSAIRHDPRILATRKKNVSWEDVVKATDRDALIAGMIEIELSEFTRLSTDGMLDYLSKHLPASLCETDRCAANEASVVRNLIIHNAAIANEELHQLNSEHQVGRTIRLSGTQVHNYGLRGRQLLRTIDEQLVEKGHLSAHAQT